MNTIFFIFQDMLYLSLCALFVSIKLCSVMEVSVDPFKPMEAILFGIINGLSDPGHVKTE